MIITEYSNRIDEIHSFDSYFAEIIPEGNHLIIPYINLGVSKHPLNMGEKLKYIDKAKMIFEDVVSFEEDYSLAVTPNMQTLFFGGFDVSRKIHREFKIVCRKARLQLFEDSKLSETMWIPIATPEYKSNMKKDEVKDFFGW